MELPEMWDDIEGYLGMYEVSSNGRVRNMRTARVLKPSVDPLGYRRVTLFRDCIGKTHKVHRLVANVFVSNPGNKSKVDHIDGDPSNNSIMNLRYATTAENCRNRRKAVNTSSRCKGVCWDRKANKWRAYIRIGGRLMHIGCFIDEVAAARAYDEKAREHFGVFAKTNF